jgi:hypothetical protein
MQGPVRGSIEIVLRTDPPSSALTQRFIPGTPRVRNIPNGRFYSRIMLDSGGRMYLGYELLLEQQQSGVYLATFGKLGLTPLDLSAGMRWSARAWTNQPIPAIPEPREIHDGETVSIDLFIDAASGEKLIDDIRIDPPRPPVIHFQPPPRAVRPIPTVSGTARDFSSADAELQILAAREIALNGTVQAPLVPPSVRGALVWLYLPEHGRYILSLAPRVDLGFRKAGEVRGGTIVFTLGKDSIKLECSSEIATGGAPYNLYVLHDAEWEPTSDRQKDRPTAGTVGADELAALKRR